MKTVIYHSADYDGIFCHQIAKKFLGTEGVNYIGWNFGEALIPMPLDGPVYILDLSPECLCGDILWQNLIWIDHHKTSINKWDGPDDPEANLKITPRIPGYRIDGVAACRLAWQWFNRVPYPTLEKEWCELPCKEYFIDRKVSEPLAVRLAGEYDVWDHRGDGDLEFQYGLRGEAEVDWQRLLTWPDMGTGGQGYAEVLIRNGKLCMQYARNMDAMWLSESWHIIEWEGLKFLAQNSVQRGSGILDSKDKPETGHDALMLYGFRGKLWTVSLYHPAHRKDLDLSQIAVKHGGGGHKGACGFTCSRLPFMP